MVAEAHDRLLADRPFRQDVMCVVVSGAGGEIVQAAFRGIFGYLNRYAESEVRIGRDGHQLSEIRVFLVPAGELVRFLADLDDGVSPPIAVFLMRYLNAVEHHAGYRFHTSHALAAGFTPDSAGQDVDLETFI